MGEDAMRILNEYLKIHSRIGSDIKSELPRVAAAMQWGQQF